MNIEKVLKDYVDESVGVSFKKARTKFDSDSEKKLGEMLDEKLHNLRPIVVDMKYKNEKLPAKIRHESTDLILKYVATRTPLLLVGPAGSGKTHIAIDCAEILQLPHYSISVNEQTSKSDFLGYVDANGKIVETNFRRAYEKGGVFIIDEIDAGNPNILTVINSALANSFCPFPDKMVDRHENFVCVCTANTFGDGESLQYIGRNILDSATKDRFASVTINYSDSLEKALVPNFWPLLKSLRTRFNENSINIVISTRGGIRLEQLNKLPNTFMSKEDVIDCLNLHQECVKDVKIASIIIDFLTKKAL